MSIRLKTQNITNMYTPIELVSTNIGQVAYIGGGGGVTDHGYLYGLSDNDHPQYLLSSMGTQFIPAGNSVSYQLTANNSLSLATGALVSLMYTSNSSNLIAVSNSSIYAVSNHTHDINSIGGALSDHSHGSVNTVSTSGTDIKFVSVSTGLTVGIPAYITTAYGVAIGGSDTYTQNTGTIQFANSNGLSFGLSNNGVMTARMEYPTQVGILGISDGVNSLVTNSSIKFANSNGMSFGFNGSTMTASYTVPGNTVFSNSNNIEFGLSGSTVTALALFAQTTQTQNVHNITLSGNTTGTLAQISSGILTLAGGSNITLSQIGNAITIIGSAGVSNSHNITIGGNSISSGDGYAQISSGTLTLAGGNNITLSQNGNALTIIGPTQGGVQTGISGIGVSNIIYTSGSVIWSAQNNITIGSYVLSNSQYVRLSVGNYITTAAASDHTHGSNVFSSSTSGADIKFSSFNDGVTAWVPAYLTTAMQSISSSVFARTGFSSQSTNGTDIVGTLNTNGLNLGIPKFVANTAAGEHTHGNINLSLTNLSGTYSSASNGLSLSLSGYPATSFAAASDMGNVYFGGGSNITWASSVSSNSTSFMVTAGGGTGGGGGIALAFSGNTTGTTQTIGAGTLQFVGGNNITLSQAGSIVTISAGSNTVANNWTTATLTSGTAIQISTGSTNTLHYPKYLTTQSAGTGVGTNFAFSNMDATFNSNGLSINGERYAGTGFITLSILGSNISATLDPLNGLRLYVPNYLTTTPAHSHSQYAGILTTGITGASATINSSQIQLNIPVGSVYFADSNGHSFSSSVNGVSTTIYIVT